MTDPTSRPVTAEAHTTVDATPEVVWQALTTPAHLKQFFMGADIATDWQVGHPITFSGEWRGEPYQDKGTIMTFDPRRELMFSHWSPLSGGADEPDNYHVVRITLEEAASGTQVELTQANLNGSVSDDDRAHRADFEQNWSGVLAGLKTTAEALAG
jgi:uncharacterized protein YndB with AHSA1/START domain